MRQAEHPGNRLQQAQSQDGQEEAAVRLQGRAQGGRGERHKSPGVRVFWFVLSVADATPTFISFTVLQEGEFQSETIRFGTERMTIDSWVRKRTYDAFREFVGSGMNYHLQVLGLVGFGADVAQLGVNVASVAVHDATGTKQCFLTLSTSPCCIQGNEFIRDVFELGPPMLVDSATMKAMKIPRFERVSVGANSADRSRLIVPASYRLFSLPASSQLCCIQGPDQSQEQVQGQEGRRGGILTFFFKFFFKLPFLIRPPAHLIDIAPPLFLLL